ncbi:Programmed cell death 6-interacting protein [Fasciola gigantica]|uniref:Programmed cell death 6-interacting protein n=1 Tax=Fasciola gigantica TaxID=46835 RepID=A0A504YU64_FASGI|nr:Programmed cell death 6-interacting protein [Fasciola gigantica]
MIFIQFFFRYHDTLFALEPRVAMGENGARVDWKWSDFSGKSKKVCSSEFERANILFCYGAIHSQIAEGCDLKDESSLKQAVISLRTAAGVFEFLAGHVSMFGSSSSEVVSDILSAYSVTMIAQAQECVFLKAESGSIPSEMVAKIASKARETYEDAWKRCSVPSCRHGIPKEWFSNLQQKIQLMSALAQYQQSKACGDARAYGEQVARLSVSGI